MRLDNNYYTNNQLNFCGLKSISANRVFKHERYIEATSNLVKAFKESESLTQFCKKYDVYADFYAMDCLSGVFSKKLNLSSAALGLTTKVKDNNNNIYPRIRLYEQTNSVSAYAALSELTRKIKNITIEELETELVLSIKILKDSITEKQTKENYIREYNDIINNLLTDNTPKKIQKISINNLFAKIKKQFKGFFKAE